MMYGMSIKCRCQRSYKTTIFGPQLMSIDLPPCKTYKQGKSGLPWDSCDWILTCVGFTIIQCHESTLHVTSKAMVVPCTSHDTS